MSAQGGDKVVRFPPLPGRPEPPRLPPDERQSRFQGIVGRIGEQIAQSSDGGFGLAVANTVTGFPASAVNLGRMKVGSNPGSRRSTCLSSATAGTATSPAG